MQQQELCIQGKFVKKLTKKVKANLWTLNLIVVDALSEKVIKSAGCKIPSNGLVRVGGIDLPSTAGIEVKYFGTFKSNGMFACGRFD